MAARMAAVSMAERLDHERLEPASPVEDEEAVDRRPHGDGLGLDPQLVRLRSGDNIEKRERLS